MQISHRKRERGQSEVIGVVLLVAVVTILAAGIGAYFITLAADSGDVDVVPQANLNAEQYGDDGQQVRLYHESGETLAAETLTIHVDDPDQGTTEFDGTEFAVDEIHTQDSVYFGIEEDASGDPVGIQLEQNADPVDRGLTAGAEIEVVWSSPDADQTQILYEYIVNSR